MEHEEFSHEHKLDEVLDQHLVDEYRKKLVNASEVESPSPAQIVNLYPWHAKEGIVALIDFARRRQWESSQDNLTTIRIMLHCLPDYLFEAIAPQLRVVLEAGANLRILIGNSRKHSQASMIAKLRRSVGYNDRLEVRGLPSRTSQDDLIQVVLVDSSAYRVEIVDSNTIQETNWTVRTPRIPARICFNDDHAGTALVACFDSLWHCVPVCKNSPGDEDVAQPPHMLKKSQQTWRFRK